MVRFSVGESVAGQSGVGRVESNGIEAGPEAKPLYGFSGSGRRATGLPGGSGNRVGCELVDSLAVEVGLVTSGVASSMVGSICALQ
jgi:hypothetical protein